MRWLLEPLARGAEHRPWTVLAVLGLLTVVLGGLASQQQVETDITEFSPDTELSRGFDRIEDEFGARGGAVQVIADAGPGGNVLDAEGLAAADRLSDLVNTTPGVADALAVDDDGDAGLAVRSYADPILDQAEAFDLSPEELTDAFAGALAAGSLDGDGGEQLSGLLSDDLDTDEARARGGLTVVEFDADLTADERQAAATTLRDEIARTDFGVLTVDVFSFDLLTEEIEGAFDTELPQLLLLSLAAMLVILAVLFRRPSDVLLGLVGLLATIVWMTGLSALLGPGYLGLTGEFSQIAIAVPVLLVGLGIDYSVHLTTRYREVRRGGAAPPPAAATAVRTVGVALILATITTLIGFLSNVVAPLPPIADFGVFAAAGVLSAFIVLGGLVPAARTVLDRRRPDRIPPPTAEGTGTDGLTRLAGALAVRAPAAVLGLAVVLAGVGVAGATALDTQFSQDEFIPDGSDAAVTLDRMDRLFGGDVAEETYVLVDADFRDEQVLAAAVEAERQLADVDGVVTRGDRADVQSPVGALVQRSEIADAVRNGLAAELSLIAGEDADLPGLQLPERMSLADLPADFRDELVDAIRDETTGGGVANADLDAGEPGEAVGFDLDELARRLPPGVDADEALAGVLVGDLAEALRAGSAEAVRDDLPEDVDEAEAARLADNPDEIALDSLEDAGYPVADLADEAREALADDAELRELGWDGDTLHADADAPGLLGVLGDAGMAEGVLRDDESAGLLRISTRVGEEGAARLADDVLGALAPLTAVGADVLVASEPLLIDETLAALSEAQTQAIVISLVAALTLLVGFYGITERRPALGLVTMLPALLAVPLVLGTMWLVGLSFNALTATIASIAVGIGVPYGIHVTNRFLEQLRNGAAVEDGITTTLANTGAALVGSAVTTAAAFGVLTLSDLAPISQFGGITAMTIGYALLAALLIESAALVAWGRWHARRAPSRSRPPKAPRKVPA